MHGASGIFLNIVLVRHLVLEIRFLRISNLWKALPSDLKSESNVDAFKNKLKHSFSLELRVVFDADDARTFKLVCCKYRRMII